MKGFSGKVSASGRWRQIHPTSSQMFNVTNRTTADMLQYGGTGLQVVVLNHHTELDWLFAWQLADRAGLVSFKILVIFLVYTNFQTKQCMETCRHGWLGEFQDIGHQTKCPHKRLNIPSRIPNKTTHGNWLIGLAWRALQLMLPSICSMQQPLSCSPEIAFNR